MEHSGEIMNEKYWYKREWLNWIVICFGFFFLAACSKEKDAAKSSHLTTVKIENMEQTLSYSGLIQPLKVTVIPSPADGVIIDAFFQYGTEVKKDQLLFNISSAKFISDYKAALVQYLKAKSEFTQGQAQLQEAEFLFKNELISKDDYKNKKASYYGMQLSFLQAKDSLDNLIKQTNIKKGNLYDLSITDIDKINQILRLDLNEVIHIAAPNTGIILGPLKGEEESSSKKLLKGETVKQGDVLAMIGNMEGLSVKIKVNELTINQIKIGQKVIVSGIAFPDDILTGKINRIDHQGDNQNNGLPSFAVEVIVPHLTSSQQQRIHVGMSAKVDITIAEEAQIQIPLEAIQEKNGLTYVGVYQKQTKKIIPVTIKTGKTTMDKVAVLSGLKVGDQIASPYLS